MRSMPANKRRSRLKSRCSFSGRKLEIRDNDAGIPAEIVERLADYSSRASDKVAYVSPTRSAQGNAWKTLLAMPFVLNWEVAVLPMVIGASSIRHQIHIRTDQIARRPRINYQHQPFRYNPGEPRSFSYGSKHAWRLTKTPKMYRSWF
jgi:hypothetical protein